MITIVIHECPYICMPLYMILYTGAFEGSILNAIHNGVCCCPLHDAVLVALATNNVYDKRNICQGL